MRENNENLLAMAWWVILNSPDLFYYFIRKKKCYDDNNFNINRINRIEFIFKTSRDIFVQVS